MSDTEDAIGRVNCVIDRLAHYQGLVVQALEDARRLRHSLQKLRNCALPRDLDGDEEQAPVSGDLFGVRASECCRRILEENDNRPMHHNELEKEAVRRGYRTRGGLTGRTAFYQAMHGNLLFEAMGRGMFRLAAGGAEGSEAVKPEEAKSDG